MKSVQVLMSTYNAGIYLEEQINSILNQSGCAISILIRDDGSSDDTVEFLKHLTEKYDNVVLLAGHDNLKPAKSFMTLLSRSGDYDYYAFADQDDIWDHDKILTAIQQLSSLSIPALYCSNARLIDGEGKKLNKEVYSNKNKATDFYTVSAVGNFLGCGMVFNRKLREAIAKGGFPNYIIMHDSYTATVCVSLGGKIIYDCIPHFSYRVHSTNTVGVAVGRMASLQRTLQKVQTPRSISVANQSEEILNRFYIADSRKKFLNKIIHYRESFPKRLKMALDVRFHFDSLNASIFTRIAFFLGNM